MAKILIVDDQRNMRTTLAMMLGGASYEADEAQRGPRLVTSPDAPHDPATRAT